MASTAQRDAMREASVPLAESLMLKPGDVFTLHSKSKANQGVDYEMYVTPEGYVVHLGEGCEGEQFSGVRGCYHSRESEAYVTQSVQVYEPAVPQRIEFSNEQLKTITDVICTDHQGEKAPQAFVELFLGACRHSGLDPFLRQIYPLHVQGKWTMFIGIDGYRVISERTGLDEGMDGPQWSNDGRTWIDYPTDDPKFARVGIWRKGVPRPYVAVVAMKAKRNPSSNSWKSDPAGMLAKCAEALARRRAFPADMAVIPETSTFEDPDGTPITSAEVPDGQWRELEQPAADVVEMITDEQKKRLRDLWDPKSEAATTLRERFPAVFPQPSPGASNRISDLTAEDAEQVIAILEAKETASTATAGPADLPATTSPASPCTHDFKWDDDKALIACVECGDPDPKQFDPPETEATEAVQPLLADT